MTALVLPLNWKETTLVKSYIPSSMLPLAGVKHRCLMYTHAPSTFSSIIPLSKPPSHAHFPQAPCCPSLFIEYIFYSATFFHLSWQLQLLWGWCTRGHRETRTLVFSLHASCSSERGPSRLKWTNREDDLDFTFFLLFSCLYYLRRSDSSTWYCPHFTSWKNNKKSIEGHQLRGDRKGI